ncbi:MAG: SUMF1/EgtB/PvdO family nonheme iron enzyme, partial [Kiritimatiellae bacterium]|nr:SUMF1/EgtB/PvdO family nonheme iron enzyme [Kiritimatiellia bacterium]
DYMIVDLETWKVTYEGMSLQKTSNAKYNTDTYKTTKLVLRKIEKGEYWIGHSQGSFNTWEVSYNTYHAVNMAKDYYIGVFPLTVAQYEKIMNNKTSSDMTMPHYSYATIRGTTGPGADPSSTCVLGKLTENTKAYLNGGNFDLPTISMWEVAARSGGLCKTHYLCGDTLTNMDKWAASSNSAIVGTCLANDWGFYDIHCNGFQLTRDMMNRGDLKDLQQDGQAPITSGTGLAAVVGSSSDYQDAAKISARSSNTFNYAAFIPRLAFIVP